ncbi:hypothetical protein BRADI_2g17493v3 [Brachypodium distachyon]|uniref:Uncharacterized protein n=1 Tax=Brachypodium distachyon TaxID=15368 RepID=A0A2K2D924_BRADI|nr:hypothetical protein BRADI_2g17493v3 [Brachypodium distachyon]
MHLSRRRHAPPIATRLDSVQPRYAVSPPPLPTSGHCRPSPQPPRPHPDGIEVLEAIASFPMAPPVAASSRVLCHDFVSPGGRGAPSPTPRPPRGLPGVRHAASDQPSATISCGGEGRVRSRCAWALGACGARQKRGSNDATGIGDAGFLAVCWEGGVAEAREVQSAAEAQVPGRRGGRGTGLAGGERHARRTQRYARRRAGGEVLHVLRKRGEEGCVWFIISASLAKPGYTILAELKLAEARSMFGSI